MGRTVLMLLGVLVEFSVSAEPLAPCPEGCTCLPVERHITCNYSNLTSVPPEIDNSTIELHMDYNNLTFLQQSFHQDLPELRSLYLRNCSIKTVKSDAFQKVTGVQHLFLDSNEIQEFENGTFDNLSNLLYLYLQENKIRYLQPGIFSPLKNLIALYLRNNLLTEISDGSLKGLTQLRWLDLGINMITKLSKEAFADSKLRKLNLQNNLLTSVPSLKNRINLQTLHLSGNRIGKLSSASFSRNFRTVRELYLDNMELKDVSSSAFRRLRRLDVLDLRNNSLTSLPVSQLKSSTIIYLSGNPWECDCSITELYIRLLMSKKNKPEQEVLCKSPKGLEGRSLTTINILDLNCKSFVDETTTFFPASQTNQLINSASSVVTTTKEVTTYKTSTPTSTTWINILEEDPCLADDIANVSVKATGEDSLEVSWSCSRVYTYFQINYGTGEDKDTLYISGAQTNIELFHLFPGTTYSVCIVPQNRDGMTCENPKPKQCASGQTSGLPETAYHAHSPPKATTSPFVIIGSTVAGVVILAAVLITAYAMRPTNFNFQRYHNEDEMDGYKQEETDPYKWDSAYENVDEARHVYVTTSSLWVMDNDKLDCSLAEPISSVPNYASL
ncbi:chondroadherin-like [Bufo gargarizans]|uniref:chondroadherin-like n=1 Tax=Bufo gargarizans TaxID=30331 RepID=UPI001CF59914|nr:chondroadherin-like [Bufo gargarizans]